MQSLGDRYGVCVVLFFCSLNMSSQYLWASIFLNEILAAVYFIAVLLYMISCFLLAAFKIFSFFFIHQIFTECILCFRFCAKHRVLFQLLFIFFIFPHHHLSSLQYHPFTTLLSVSMSSFSFFFCSILPHSPPQPELSACSLFTSLLVSSVYLLNSTYV